MPANYAPIPTAPAMLDTDILILLQRLVPEAQTWLGALTVAPTICFFAALELLFGCQNAKEKREAEALLAQFEIAYPTQNGLEMSRTFASLKLSHGLGSFDALIAATALEHNLPLYTFNVKHFNAVPNLQVIVPYVR